MKIVQSFWTKPFTRFDPMINDGRFNGGWPHRILNYYSWALSCLQLCRFYDSVELITDELGKEILIDKLELPYTNVVVALDSLDVYGAGMWTMGKIHAYSLQREPFLHVDSDIFISQQFEDDIVNARLVAQNLEEKGPGYSSIFLEICKTFPYVPAYFEPLRSMGFSPSCNAGIFGGTDISFFQDYVNEISCFLQQNEEHIDRMLRISAGDFSVVLEQVIFYAYAQARNKEIVYLLPAADGIPADIGYFHLAPMNRNFVHCVSYYKRDRLSYSYLEWELREKYPVYYQRIHTLISHSEI